MFRTICLGPGSSSPRMHANGGGRLTQPTRAPRHKIQKTRRKTMTGRRKPQMRTLHFSYSLGNGNPVQCSCLENPEDGGAWWAAVYGVAQSRTRLKQFSSSLRIIHLKFFWNPNISIILRFYFYLDEIITCIILCFTAVCCFNIILPSLSYKLLGVVTILGKSVTFSFCWIIWTDTSIGVSSWIVGWLE